MEFARGFGVRDYRVMLGSTAANQTRLKTPSEFRGRISRAPVSPAALVRRLLFAVYKTGIEGDPHVGRDWLRQGDYLPTTTGSPVGHHRVTPISLPDARGLTMTHWSCRRATAPAAGSAQSKRRSELRRYSSRRASLTRFLPGQEFGGRGRL